MADRKRLDIAAQIFSDVTLAFFLFVLASIFLLSVSNAQTGTMRQHPYYGCKARVVFVNGSFQYKPVLDRRGRPICKGRRA